MPMFRSHLRLIKSESLSESFGLGLLDEVLGETQQSSFLTSYLVMLMLLVHKAHFESPGFRLEEQGSYYSKGGAVLVAGLSIHFRLC